MSPLSRKTQLRADPEKVKSWLNRRKPIPRKQGIARGTARLRAIGRRAKRDRESGRVFGPLAAMVRRLNCDACGAPPRVRRAGGVPENDPHHVRPRGAGFGDWIGGDGNLVALCRKCHDHAEDNPLWLKDEFTARAREHGEFYRNEIGGS